MHIIQFKTVAWSIFFLAINLTLCYTFSVTSNLQETFSFKEKSIILHIISQNVKKGELIT